MIKFLRKIFCFHLNWKIPLISKKLRMPYETEWACTKCDKRILLDSWKEPIQFLGV